jgi:hypothetical protein
MFWSPPASLESLVSPAQLMPFMNSLHRSRCLCHELSRRTGQSMVSR